MAVDDHIAYLLVHSFACWLYRTRSVLYILAISGTNGSSGFGSVSIEQMESNTASINTHTSRNTEHDKFIILDQSFTIPMNSSSSTNIGFVRITMWNHYETVIMDTVSNS